MSQLKTYKKKRDFKKTPEPQGAEKSSSKEKNLIFTVQKHAATRLHYDLRLECNGVLKSWAVPKGPSLDPEKKHLAVRVEDHPISYATFEGIIPKGEYGGGTVMLWDKGEWIPCGGEDFDKTGKLDFILKGKNLKGLWHLVRMKNNPKNWLLFKGNDKYARPAADYDILEDQAKSVKSKLSMTEIAEKDYNFKKK